MKTIRLGHRKYMLAIGGVAVSTREYDYTPCYMNDDGTIATWWQFPRDTDYTHANADVLKSHYEEVEIVER